MRVPSLVLVPSLAACMLGGAVGQERAAAPPAPSEARSAYDRLPIDAEVPVGDVRYDPAFPLPESVLGHRVGERHTRPEQVVEWFRAVGARSDRVVVDVHGRSVEGRPLVHAIVTAPENHARLAELLAANRRLGEEPAAVDDATLARMPLVAWMGYGVHGDEASAHEAPILLLYHLAAGRGPTIDRLLREAIVLIVPCLNPDGHDRFVDWVNGNRAFAAPTADDQDREHRQPWPGGRTNHYLFDLNRDWLAAVQPSSRARLELWGRFHPQLQTDFHEMGGSRSYFFQPGIGSRTNPLTPRRNQELTAAIARYHARGLDAVAQPYFTGESFDDYFYGKGSTYPDVRGAVGILFEQGSARGLRRDTDWGELRYVTTVRNQVITSLTSLEAGIAMREVLLWHMRWFYLGADEAIAGAPGAALAFGAPGGGDRTRAQLLVQALLRHGVHVHEHAELGYVVPVAQPEARLVRALLEPVTEFPDTEFYDVSTWTLPLAYGVEHRWLDAVPATPGAPLGSLELDGGQLREAATEHGPVAWALRWDRLLAPRALARLWDAGARPRVLTAAATWLSGGRPERFQPGTIVVPLGADDTDRARIRRAAEQAAREDCCEVFGLDTMLPADGPAAGGPSTVELARPRVAILAGQGSDTYGVGEVWFTLAERYHLEVSLLEQRDAGALDLSRYSVVIATAPPGSAAERVTEFVRRGGTLVALGRGADWAVSAGLSPGAVENGGPEPVPPETEVPYSERAARAARDTIAGAILQMHLDHSHPLGFAVRDPLPVFRTSTSHLRGDVRAVGRYARPVRLSGYVPQRFLELLPGTPGITVAGAGSGKVVACLDDLAFRGFFLASERVLVNAVVFAGVY
ncbi:MAG: peptidase M14 [Planctomycetes bacterium]|nr:peptidase M14 [Planctomycetota bacterium]